MRSKRLSCRSRTKAEAEERLESGTGILPPRRSNAAPVFRGSLATEDEKDRPISVLPHSGLSRRSRTKADGPARQFNSLMIQPARLRLISFSPAIPAYSGLFRVNPGIFLKKFANSAYGLAAGHPPRATRFVYESPQKLDEPNKNQTISRCSYGGRGFSSPRRTCRREVTPTTFDVVQIRPSSTKFDQIRPK